MSIRCNIWPYRDSNETSSYIQPSYSHLMLILYSQARLGIKSSASLLSFRLPITYFSHACYMLRPSSSPTHYHVSARPYVSNSTNHETAVCTFLRSLASLPFSYNPLV